MPRSNTQRDISCDLIERPTAPPIPESTPHAMDVKSSMFNAWAAVRRLVEDRCLVDQITITASGARIRLHRAPGRGVLPDAYVRECMSGRRYWCRTYWRGCHVEWPSHRSAV